MKNKKDEFVDDGHVIADMSNVGHKVIKNEFKSENVEELKGKNLLAFITGTLSATLLIALAYIVGIGLVILLMYLLFKYIK